MTRSKKINSRAKGAADAEVWRPVPLPEFKTQEVSNLGRLRTSPQAEKKYGTVPGRILGQGRCDRGYPQATLCIGHSQRKTVKVHRLVALAFLGPKPFAEAQVNHLDGDKTNNRVENLEYVTPAENVRHAVQTGLSDTPKTRAARAAQAGRGQKLTADIVTTIRAAVAAGAKRALLAERYGVHVMTIGEIVRREIWSSVP